MAETPQADVAPLEPWHVELNDGHATLSGDSAFEKLEDDSAGHPRTTRPTNKWFNIVIEEDEDGDVSKLDKPFKTWLLDQVEAIALTIAEKYGPGMDEQLFLKAARVLHDTNPESWQKWEESYPQLTTGETVALEKEPDLRFGDQPWPLKITYFMLFVAAVVQGWNQTATNGANLSWPADLLSSGQEAILQLGNGTTIDFRNQATVEIENGSALVLENGSMLHFDDQTSLIFNGTTIASLGNGTQLRFDTQQALRFGNGTVLHLGDSSKKMTCGTDTTGKWEFAAVNAAPYLAASVGCWFSDPLINELLFGRRGAIWVSAFLIVISATGGALATTPTELLIWRVILGLGMGCKASVVPVFAAEIAPPHLRGSLVMNWQVFDSLGILLGFSANLVASTAGTSAWRWQIGCSALPALVLLSAASFLSWDSPRFLMKHEEDFKKRHEERRPGLLYKVLWPFKPSPNQPYQSETYNTLLLLRGQPILAAKELIHAHCQLLIEDHLRRQPEHENAPMDFSLKSRSGWLGRLKDLFVIGHLRRAVYAAAVVMISQQLCGINVLILYSSSVFCDAAVADQYSSSISPLLLSWGIGLTNFLGALPAYKWIESKGRRYLLLATLPLLALAMACAAGSFTIVEHIPKQIAVGIFTYIFTIIYSPGMGPVPFTLSAEIFPLEQRMVGMSLAVSLNFAGLGILALLAPRDPHQAHLLGIFSTLNIVAFAFVWVFVREVARGRSDIDSSRTRPLGLEELFHIFNRPTREHIDYQWLEVLPKTVNRVLHKLSGGSESERPPPPKLFREWYLQTPRIEVSKHIVFDELFESEPATK